MKKLILTFEANIPNKLAEEIMRRGIKWEKLMLELEGYKTKVKMTRAEISYAKESK